MWFQAQKVSDDLMQKIGSKKSRALDLIAAKCYYYHARVYEFLTQLDTIRRYTGLLVPVQNQITDLLTPEAGGRTGFSSSGPGSGSSGPGFRFFSDFLE